MVISTCADYDNKTVLSFLLWSKQSCLLSSQECKCMKMCVHPGSRKPVTFWLRRVQRDCFKPPSSSSCSSLYPQWATTVRPDSSGRKCIPRDSVPVRVDVYSQRVNLKTNTHAAVPELPMHIYSASALVIVP